MPSVIRNPDSLFESCLQHVAYNFANTNRSDQTEKLLTGDLEGELRDLNPLQKLPSALLLQITNLLVRKRWLKNIVNIQQLERLITTETKMLCLSSMPIESERRVAHFLQLAASLCPTQLTILVTDCVKMCPLEYYNQFLPQFKNLQVLSVSGNYSKFNDSCMRILGLHCKDLRELDVTYCDVTDQGIEWLCAGPTDLGGQVVYGQCKSLQKLSIRVFKIEEGFGNFDFNDKCTLKGLEIALRNLPNLEILEHDNVLEALVDMHKNDVVLPKYRLIKLIIACMISPSIPYGKCALHLVARLCPYITGLIIKAPLITDLNLMGLTALEKLRELEVSYIHFSVHFPITFDGGLVPLLKACGSSLEVLKFNDFKSDEINLDVIMEYCPNLERLSLDNCCSSLLTGLEARRVSTRPSDLKKKEFMWVQLEKLNLRAGYHRDVDDDEANIPIPPDVLLFILSRSPSLKHLEFSFCDTIDDDLLQQVFVGAHEFKSLEYLSFSHCNSVTKVGINLFMNETNMLKKLMIDECKLVYKNDIVDWQEKAKTSNWDFQVNTFK